MLSYKSNPRGDLNAEPGPYVAGKAPAISRWAGKTPPNCEACGDWGTVSNPDPYGHRIPCPCGANPFARKRAHTRPEQGD